MAGKVCQPETDILTTEPHEPAIAQLCWQHLQRLNVQHSLRCESAHVGHFSRN